MSKIFTIKNSQNNSLVGDIYENSKEHIIIMSHGFLSHRNCGGFFPKVAEALSNNDFSVIKFDFSGCGESDDTELTIEKQIDDLKTMISYAKELGYKNISLFGHSLGGLVTFSVANQIKDIHKIVVTAPVTYKNRYEWHERYSTEQLHELENDSRITFATKQKNRKSIIVNKQLFDERSAVVQEELLKNITNPTLIIHGDTDERVPILDSQNAITYLHKECRLDVIEKAKHSFKGFDTIVIEKTIDWLKE